MSNIKNRFDRKTLMQGIKLVPLALWLIYTIMIIPIVLEFMDRVMKAIFANPDLPIAYAIWIAGMFFCLFFYLDEPKPETKEKIPEDNHFSPGGP